MNKSRSHSTNRSNGSRSNGQSGSKNNRSTKTARKQNRNGGSTEGLQKLFEHQLTDLYYVEKQLTKHLPKMAEKAVNEQLSAAFTDHLQETEGQLKRLDKVFALIGKPPKGKQCEAIDGILTEAKEMIEEFDGDPALDAALAAAAQKVEHYEITSYGSLCAFAEQLGLDEVCDQLEANLDEEKAADKKLSRLAEDVLNIEADENAQDTGEAEAGTGGATDEEDMNEEEEDDEEEESANDGTRSTRRSKKEYAAVH